MAEPSWLSLLGSQAPDTEEEDAIEPSWLDLISPGFKDTLKRGPEFQDVEAGQSILRQVEGGMPTAQVPIPDAGVIQNTAQGIYSSLGGHVPATLRAVSQGLNTSLGSVVGGGGKLAADVIRQVAPGPAQALEQLSEEAARPLMEAGAGRFESPENVARDLAAQQQPLLQQLAERPIETVAGAGASMLPFIAAPELAPATMAAMGRQSGEEAALAGGATPEVARVSGQSQAAVDMLVGDILPKRLAAAFKGELGSGTKKAAIEAAKTLGITAPTGFGMAEAHQAIQKIATGAPMNHEEALGEAALMAILGLTGHVAGAAERPPERARMPQEPRSTTEPTPAQPEIRMPQEVTVPKEVTESVTGERRGQPELREAVDYLLPELRQMDEPALRNMMDEAVAVEDVATEKAIERVMYERSGQEAKRLERVSLQQEVIPSAREETQVAQAPETAAKRLGNVWRGRPVWEMSEQELRDAFASQSEYETGADERVLGREGAKEYARLQLKANSVLDMEGADEASAKIAEIESRLTPEQLDVLAGIGETGPNAEDFKQLIQNTHLSDTSSPTELGRMMMYAISKINPGDDPALMNQDQLAAYITVRRVAEIAKERGWDTKLISNEAIRLAAGRWADPDDAALMLSKWLKHTGAPPRFPLLSEESAMERRVPTVRSAPETASRRERVLEDVARVTEAETPPPPEEVRQVGSTFGNVAQELFGDQLAALPEKTAPVKSLDAEVEQRFSAARGIQVPGMKEKVKEAAKGIVASFRRRDVNIDPNKSPEFARLADEFRVYDAASNAAITNAADTIRSVTRDLTPNQGDLFGRILALRDIEKQGDLPFGYKSQADVKADLNRFEAELAKPENAKIQDALDAREAMLEKVKQQLVAADLLPEAVNQDPRYFHRMVMAYASTVKPVGAGRSSVRLGQKGFQKKRTGSSADFNTSYHQAEFEFLSDALQLLEKKKTIDNIDSISNIASRLKAEAKAKFGDADRWKELLPEDYTLWQPARGNHFYPALTITEATLDKVLQGTKALERGDVREALAMGGPKAEWAIPKELAAALDKRTKKTDAALEKFWTGAQATWKQWVLLNPWKAIKYNLNNMSGDLDIAIASDPGLTRPKYTSRAWGKIWDYHIKKSSDPKLLESMHEAQRLGVLDSGFSAADIPDISKEGVLRAMLETKPGRATALVSRYWKGIKNFSTARENFLRLSAYEYFQDQWAAGKKRYGASVPEQIDSISDPKRRAAKLARELIGDYGNISEAGQWARRHLIPFYSWMEINAPRYVRLMRNVKFNEEAGAGKRVAGVVAKRAAIGGAKLAVKANALFLLTQAWNHAMFPEEEKQLGEARRDPHIILGRDETTGEIRSLRFQGALADALDWLDLSDWPSDVMEAKKGKKTAKAIAAEAVKRPVEKTIQAFEPFTKTIYEIASGRSMYPRMFKKGESFKVNPRVIFDRGEQVAKTFSVDRIYNRVMNKPRRPSDNVVVYKTDPGEAAYFETRALVNDWLQKNDKEPVTGFEKNKRQLALYYMKKAMQWKDAKRVIYWRKKYFDLGGTDEGMEKSIAKSAPLGAMSDEDELDFWDSLSPEDQEIVQQAEQWYEQRMAD